jgi:putative ABC transport system permease protein
MEAFLQDLRYAVRRIARSPGLVAVAVLSLALGIGAKSTMFSIADGILLRPLPIEDPAGLIAVWSKTQGSRGNKFSYPEYLDLREQAQSFSGLAAYDRRGGLLQVGGETELLHANPISENYFSVLGVRPALGRAAFTDPSEPAVVISYNLWQRRFGGDPNIVGRKVVLSRTDVVVVGVAPRNFRGLERHLAIDVWIPMPTWAAMGGAQELRDRSSRHLQIVGRLKSSASLPLARAELDTVASRLAAAYPASNLKTTYLAQQEARPALGNIILGSLLLAPVGLVLLICCANVAGLLIAQAETRRQEMAVRLSLGASRWRIFRLLLTESLLLSLLGGALGLLLAAWLIRLFPALLPAGPISFDVRMDSRVLVFTLFASVLATLIFGLVPARQATKTDVSPVLKGVETNIRQGRWRFSLRDVLVVGQVTFSFVLLATAALLLRSLLFMLNMDAGFDSGKQMLIVRIVPAFLEVGPEKNLALHEEMVERFRSLPGVKRASYSRRFALSGSGGGATREVVIPGYVAPSGKETWDIKYNAIAPGYLQTVGTSLLRGRDFHRGDHAASQPVMLISDAMARQFWPNEDPVGKSLRVTATDRQIVGIVKDIKINRLQESNEPYIYLPFAQAPSGETTLVIETTGDPRTLVSAVRQEIRRTGPNLPVLDIITLRDQMDAAVYDQKMPAELAGGLGLLGMFLAAVGLYGVVSYAVNRRAHEIGIRMALGAQRADIAAMVLRQGMRLVAVGTVLGALATLGAGRLLGGLIYGVSPHDPLSLAASVLVVVAITLVACYLPARRAARVDPMVALRFE